MSGRAWNCAYASHAAFYQHVYGRHVTGLDRLGSAGAILIEAVQSAGDWSDAPTPDLTVGWVSSESIGVSADLGAGRFSGIERTGDAIVIAPGAGASIQVDGPHTCRLIALPYAGLRAWTVADDRELPENGDLGPLHHGFIRDANLRRTMDAAWIEARSGGPRGRLYGDGLVLQLVGLLGRTRERPGSTAAKGGLAPWQVRRVSDYLEDHLANDVTLAELGELLGLSTFHLCRAFKQSTGLPPYRWRRMERGRELLEGTNLSITEIAAAVGYDDPSRFASGFRKAFGLSPSGYRRERRS